MTAGTKSEPVVAVLMGSQSDWATMKEAVEMLNDFGVASVAKITSAHRTPDRVGRFAMTAEENGFQVIIAGAGGAAHLAGMLASKTWIPVIAVPIQSKALNGMDSLLSTVQMPPGIPVATMAIGGAKNAALTAVAILALNDKELAGKLINWRYSMSQSIDEEPKD